MRRNKSIAAFVFFLFGATFHLPLIAEEDAENTESKAVAKYITMQPPFVTNVLGENGRLHFVRAEIALRVQDSATESAVNYHDHLLKNQLVMLLSGQNFDSVSSSQGRDSLREEVLMELTATLEEEEAASDIVDVLFTNFIVE